MSKTNILALKLCDCLKVVFFYNFRKKRINGKVYKIVQIFILQNKILKKFIGFQKLFHTPPLQKYQKWNINFTVESNYWSSFDNTYQENIDT